MAPVNHYVTEDGVHFLDGAPITFQGMAERFCVSSDMDLCLRVRSGEPGDGFIFMLSVEIVGKHRFIVVTGNDIDALAREAVQKWDAFEMAAYRSEDPKEPS